jgi:hypothetical protein
MALFSRQGVKMLNAEISFEEFPLNRDMHDRLLLTMQRIPSEMGLPSSLISKSSVLPVCGVGDASLG